MSDDEKKIKVTDKRMFTPTGELRDEFREMEARRPEEVSAPEPESTPIVGANKRAGQAETREEFFVLLEMLAQGAAYYLQQSQVAGPDMQQNLAAARQHVELMEVLQEKTEGNLSAEEKAALDDTLYRLRMAVVDKRG